MKTFDSKNTLIPLNSERIRKLAVLNSILPIDIVERDSKIQRKLLQVSQELFENTQVHLSLIEKEKLTTSSKSQKRKLRKKLSYYYKISRSLEEILL